MVPAGGDCVQVSGPQLSVAQNRATWQKSGITSEQFVTVSGIGGKAALPFVRQAQFNTGGVVSTTVTVWLHEARCMQLSCAVQVRVITCGQVPLVVVVTLMSVTPLPVVPACGQQ